MGRWWTGSNVSTNVRDLQAELNTWLDSLPSVLVGDRRYTPTESYQELETQTQDPLTQAAPILGRMPPPLALSSNGLQASSAHSEPAYQYLEVLSAWVDTRPAPDSLSTAQEHSDVLNERLKAEHTGALAGSSLLKESSARSSPSEGAVAPGSASESGVDTNTAVLSDDLGGNERKSAPLTPVDARSEDPQTERSQDSQGSAKRGSGRDFQLV